MLEKVFSKKALLILLLSCMFKLNVHVLIFPLKILNIIAISLGLLIIGVPVNRTIFVFTAVIKYSYNFTDNESFRPNLLTILLIKL